MQKHEQSLADLRKMKPEEKASQSTKVRVYSPQRDGEFKGKGYWSGQQHWPPGTTVRKVTLQQLQDLLEDHVSEARVQVIDVGEHLEDEAETLPAMSQDELMEGTDKLRKAHERVTEHSASLQNQATELREIEERLAKREAEIARREAALPLKPVDPAAPPGNTAKPPEEPAPAAPPAGAKPPKGK